jgi:hypothetical protein
MTTPHFTEPEETFLDPLGDLLFDLVGSRARKRGQN